MPWRFATPGVPALTHYSDVPLGFVGSHDQALNPDRVVSKPCGLWVSIDDDGCGWRDWCLTERFKLKNLTHVHDLTLAPGSRVLHVASADEVLALDREYKADSQYGDFFNSLDWQRIALQYQGLIISPYIYRLRLDLRTLWYDAWDCASGCIWDASAIASVTLRAVLVG